MPFSISAGECMCTIKKQLFLYGQKIEEGRRKREKAEKALEMAFSAIRVMRTAIYFLNGNNVIGQCYYGTMEFFFIPTVETLGIKILQWFLPIYIYYIIYIRRWSAVQVVMKISSTFFFQKSCNIERLLDPMFFKLSTDDVISGKKSGKIFIHHKKMFDLLVVGIFFCKILNYRNFSYFL